MKPTITVTRSRLRYQGYRVHWLRVGLLFKTPKALCGQRAGRTSAGWRESQREVDCPRCLARVSGFTLNDVTGKERTA